MPGGHPSSRCRRGRAREGRRRAGAGMTCWVQRPRAGMAADARRAAAPADVSSAAAATLKEIPAAIPGRAAVVAESLAGLRNARRRRGKPPVTSARAESPAAAEGAGALHDPQLGRPPHLPSPAVPQPAPSDWHVAGYRRERRRHRPTPVSATAEATAALKAGPRARTAVDDPTAAVRVLAAGQAENRARLGDAPVARHRRQPAVCARNG